MCARGEAPLLDKQQKVVTVSVPMCVHVSVLPSVCPLTGVSVCQPVHLPVSALPWPFICLPRRVSSLSHKLAAMFETVYELSLVPIKECIWRMIKPRSTARLKLLHHAQLVYEEYI